MRAGAPPLVLEDDTPPNGPRIDVGRRTGWLLRTARQLCPTEPRLQDVADHLGVSVAMVHRAEMGAIRSTRVCAAYEQVLGLAPGAIRGPVGALSRTFPYGPADRGAWPEVTSVVAMSALTDVVEQPSPSGGDWLDWAGALARSGAIGLPVDLASDLIGKLISELDRSVAGGYPTRYEALALLRCGPYGEVMLDVARRHIDDPHVQRLSDLMSAVGALASPVAISWCLELLRDPRDAVVTGAVLALENMAAISLDPDFWRPLVEPILDVYNDTEPDSEPWRWTSHLLRLMPPEVLIAAHARPGQPLAPAARALDPAAPSSARLDEAAGVARAVTDALGRRPEPMLARLVHDIAFGPQETRYVTSCMLLTALPGITAGVIEQLSTVAEEHPDAVIRDRVARRLVGFADDTVPSHIEQWLASEGQLRRTGLWLAGTSGFVLDDDLMVAALHDERTRRPALHAAGMTAHPVLARLADDPAEDPTLRGAAEWLLGHGPRVVDAGPDPQIWGCRPPGSSA